jgi:hypothetical protein
VLRFQVGGYNVGSRMMNGISKNMTQVFILIMLFMVVMIFLASMVMVMMVNLSLCMVMVRHKAVNQR